MLNQEQIQKVRLTLSGAGWNDVMKPALLRRGQTAVKALMLDPLSERDAEFKGTDFSAPDHVLRAMIRDIEWMVSVWDNEVRAADHNRVLDELEQANGSSCEPGMTGR